MASTRLKAKRNGSHSNKTRFFKIILDPEDHMLKLPKSFMIRCGLNLPYELTLKAPNGTIRKLDLVHHDGETYLDEGWQEFKEFYSIQLGHMVVFTYDGISHFDVLIFDTTYTEIEYPIDNARDVERIINHRADKMPIKEEYESESDSDDSPPVLRAFRSDFKGKGKCNEAKGQLCKPKRRVRPNMDMESSIAFQKAAALKFNNPSFVKPIHRSNVTQAYVIEIPVAFMREHLCVKKDALELKIRVHDERTWDVRCCIGTNRASLTSGWKKFVKDNALKPGDACAFEMDKSDMSLWKVTIVPR